MTVSTSTLGIFQSDIIIRTAIMQGLAELRSNSWMLDYAFASLKHDTLTAKAYGEKEIENAKKWFLSSEIPVFMAYRIDEATFPCISIALHESTEVENTIGDVHYDVKEDHDAPRPTVYGPFIPLDYSVANGTITLPSTTSSVFPGMVVVDRKGREHTILETPTGSTVKLASGTVADFTNATVKPRSPAYVVTLESAGFKESYSLGLHVNKNDVHLSYLHSIVTFVLLRNRQALLEARGFERSSISSSDMSKNEAFDNELIFSRYITVSGSVRQYWPKERLRKIDGLNMGLVPSVVGIDGETLDASQIDSWADRDMLDLNGTHS